MSYELKGLCFSKALNYYVYSKSIARMSCIYFKIINKIIEFTICLKKTITNHPEAYDFCTTKGESIIKIKNLN